MYTPEERDSILARLMQALRTEMAALDAPPDIEQALLAAFSRQYPKQRWYQNWYQRFSTTQWRIAAGLCGSALMVMFVVGTQHASLEVPTMIARPAVQATRLAAVPLEVPVPPAQSVQPALSSKVSKMNTARPVRAQPNARFAHSGHTQSRPVIASELQPNQTGNQTDTLAGTDVMVFADGKRTAVRVRTQPFDGFDNDGVFVALDSLERIGQEPSPRMLKADLPRIALASLGVPVTPDNAGESIRAEMVVGADGHPLALRLLALN